MSPVRLPRRFGADETALGRLRVLLGGNGRTALLLVCLSFVSGLAEAGTLSLIAQIAAGLVSGSRTLAIHAGPLHAHAALGTLVLIGLALALIRLCLQWPLTTLPARMGAGVQANLRRRLFSAFVHASWSAQAADREGHLQELMTSQIVMATQGALQLTVLINALATALVLVASAFVLNAVAAIAVFSAAVLLFTGLRPLTTLGRGRARSLSQAQLDHASAVGEAVRMAEETHVYGVADAQRARLEALIGNSERFFFRSQRVARLVPALYQSLIFVVMIGGLGLLYLADTKHFAALGAVVLLMVRTGTYGQQVQSSYQTVHQSLPYVERIDDAIKRYGSSRAVAGTQALERIDELSFTDVSYAYRRGRPVLTGIDFTVERGEVVGIIGPSGAGKSTLVQLLLQLRAPASGRFRLNRIDAADVRMSDWHRLVAYVSQEPRLIHASVAENIRFYRSMSDEAVERAARLARIHDEVMSWSEGYDTMIGPRADAVSGGQQQRICLARALAAEPELLILDEPTSALDPRSESLLQDSLRSLTGSVTMFIVAHRMSTLDICDRVMVIVDGKLDACAPAQDLREENAYYRSALAVAARATPDL